MKKLLTITGLAVAVALSSHAQGYVIFSSNTHSISTNDFVGDVGKTQGQGNYYYGLFWSPTISSGAPLQGNTDLAAYAFNTAGWTYDSDPTAIAASIATPVPGRFAPIAPNSDGSTTVPGTTGGDSYHFVIVGWSANLGSTLAQMEANLAIAGEGYIGQSAVSGLLQTGNGNVIPPQPIMGGAAPFIPGFTLGAIVPEPGTLALAALGGASLLLFRRKK